MDNVSSGGHYTDSGAGTQRQRKRRFRFRHVEPPLLPENGTGTLKPLARAPVVGPAALRLTRPLPEWKLQAHRRPVLHWTLYAMAVVVPLLGWAGISDFGSRELFPGYSLPAIWPEGAGYDGPLLQFHAYLAFSLIALVALHIGIAIQDYMTDRRIDEDGG